MASKQTGPLSTSLIYLFEVKKKLKFMLAFPVRCSIFWRANCSGNINNGKTLTKTHHI